MPFWKSRPKRTAEDPVFGCLHFDGAQWQTTVAVAGESDSVLVAVDSGLNAPGDLERVAFRKLLADLPRLSEAISDALFELYRPNQELPDWTGPRAPSPQALRSMLELSSINISEGSQVELIFGFRGDAWPDAMFVLAIDDSGVRALSLDD